MEKLKISPPDIRATHKEVFLAHQVARPQSKRSYAFDRGLMGRSDPDGIESYSYGYLDILPTFQGLNFLQLVENKIQSGNNPVILDIGYGAGNFLLDCRKIWGDEVELNGYGPSAQTRSHFLRGSLSNPPTAKLLENAEIDLIDGDLIDFSRVYGHEKADIIVSVTALQHTYYPQWELVKKIYRGLKSDGIGLLHWTSDVVENMHSQLGYYLLESGYEFEFDLNTVALRKNKPDLNLPIRTVRWDDTPKFKIYDFAEFSKIASRLP